MCYESVQLFCSLDIGTAPVGTKMTGTYQRLDSDSGSQSFATQYGSPTSPTAAPGDDVIAISSSDPTPGSPTSLQNNIPSDSTERLHPENGVLSDEHAPSTETNKVINPSRFSFKLQFLKLFSVRITLFLLCFCAPTTYCGGI